MPAPWPRKSRITRIADLDLPAGLEHSTSCQPEPVNQQGHKNLGPKTPEEFAMWPRTIVKRVFERGDGNDALPLARFKSLVAGGLHVYSDYSGMAGEFEALFQLGEALASLNSKSAIDVSVISANWRKEF